VELEQLVADIDAARLGMDAQRVRVARAKLGERVVGRRADRLLQLVQTPKVVLEVSQVFFFFFFLVSTSISILAVYQS